MCRNACRPSSYATWSLNFSICMKTVSTIFWKFLQYLITWKSVQVLSSCSVHTDEMSEINTPSTGQITHQRLQTYTHTTNGIRTYHSSDRAIEGSSRFRPRGQWLSFIHLLIRVLIFIEVSKLYSWSGPSCADKNEMNGFEFRRGIGLIIFFRVVSDSFIPEMNVEVLFKSVPELRGRSR